jgi:hypothetical protein
VSDRADAIRALISVLNDARTILSLPNNDFSWSYWGSADVALREIDGLLAHLHAAQFPPHLDLEIVFAPAGPMQEVSLSSGWGQTFRDIAARFDAAAELASSAGAWPPPTAT